MGNEYVITKYLGIGGPEDTRLICGTTAAEKKGKQGKEGKVMKNMFWSLTHIILDYIIFSP